MKKPLQLLLLLATTSALAQLGGPALDPQALGWRDDGTDQGALATQPALATLVPRSIRAGTTVNGFMRYESAGGASIANSFRQLSGPSYAGHVCAITCPAADFSYVKVKLTVYGRRFGVQWYYTTGQTTEPFTVVIDGKAYEVPFSLKDPLSQSVVTQPDPFLQWVCPDLLDDTRHEVEIIFLGDRPSGSSRTWIVRNVLLDASAGYVEQRPLDTLHGPVTATTSYADFNPSSPWDPSNVRVVRVNLVNTAAHSVDIQLATSASDANRFALKTIGAGDTAVFDFGPNGIGLAPMYLKASTNSAVLVWVQANNL
jgi:hypothetical protein